MRYRTKILHSGKSHDPLTGAVTTPIYQVSTFLQGPSAPEASYYYSRWNNPTREALELTIADLEGGGRGFAFSSGMAAISSVFLLLASGDHVIVPFDVYGGTYRLLTAVLERWGLRHTFVDMTDKANIVAALQPETRAIFVESPSNPLLRITDLRGVVEIARESGIVTILDNTFMTPYLQQPLQLGFDIAVHSATKFLGGHSDVVAGLAVTRDTALGDRLKEIHNSVGAILGPQDSWLIIRGINTLAARMDAQQETAAILAAWLLEQPEVVSVYYPTLSRHPGRELHLSQASGGGAVLSFELPDGRFVQDFVRHLELPLYAVSLGGVESILSHPATMSHAALPPEERLRRGITPGLLRLSVGLEDSADLCEDIRQALDKARDTRSARPSQ
jgi:cysteine-S-conjugate beta-lyase